MVTIEINNPKLEAIYSKKEIISLFLEYIKELENDKLNLYQVNYDDLTKEHQEVIDKIKTGNTKDLELIEY